MSNLPYIEDLRQALSTLGEVENKLLICRNEKELLREKVRMWLDMTNLREFEIMDSDDLKLWRMTITESSRRSADFDYIEQTLTPTQYDEAINITEIETFKCQTVKIPKKKNVKRAPQAIIK